MVGDHTMTCNAKKCSFSLLHSGDKQQQQQKTKTEENHIKGYRKLMPPRQMPNDMI